MSSTTLEDSSCCPSSLERAVTAPTQDILLNMHCFNTELEFGNFCFCFSVLVLIFLLLVFVWNSCMKSTRKLSSALAASPL